MIFGHSHRQTEHRLQKLFTEGLSQAETTKTLDQAQACPTCRTFARHMYRLEAALSRSSIGTSTFSKERMASAVFARIAAPKRPRVFRSLRLIVTPAAAIAAAAAIILLLVPAASHRVALSPSINGPASEIVSRGAAPSISPDFGIRAFTLSRDTTRVREGDGISTNDILTFTYTLAGAGDGYLLLFGLQQDKNVIWYYPDYGESWSIRIRGNRVDEPLGDGFAVSVKHREGVLGIFALFSDVPISTRDIESAVDALPEDSPIWNDTSGIAWESLGRGVRVYSIFSTVEDNHE